MAPLGQDGNIMHHIKFLFLLFLFIGTSQSMEDDTINKPKVIYCCNFLTQIERRHKKRKFIKNVWVKINFYPRRTNAFHFVEIDF